MPRQGWDPKGCSTTNRAKEKGSQLWCYECLWNGYTKWRGSYFDLV